jgi:prephenate dehydrogenase
LFVGLYPRLTIATIKKLAPKLRRGAVVVDLCGVKTLVNRALAETLTRRGLIFIGGHPMAGREISGFSAAKENLFHNASMLLCPPPLKNSALKTAQTTALAALRELFLSLGFSRVVITTPKIHDRVIAFTSQLPHLISSAYVKSSTALKHRGYAAGSFRDLSRVAAMNAQLWGELFGANRAALLAEVDTFIAEMQNYRAALAAPDSPSARQKIRELIDDGTRRKREIDSE